jgi:pyruvate kinase
VTRVFDDRVETQVALGGLLKEHKGVNLPGAQLNIPGFTHKDEEDLAFGLEQGIDAVAISFVRSAKDIQLARQAITRFETARSSTPIIAKLERPEALDNLEEIMHNADGVMVARGDLGVEMSAEAVPIAQKEIIESANCHARVVITATQMLDSMIYNPRPTRAEASDVANAIFDGSDAVMLSGETAAGRYPVQAVETMNDIICEAESHLDKWGHWKGTCTPESHQDDAFFVTLAARELAHDRNVAAIAVFTQSGRTALLMSKTRPQVPILAFTPNEKTYQRLNAYWGVQPHKVQHVETIDDMLKVVEAAMIASSTIKSGQQVVVICGYPVREVRPTNLALLYTVGETLK